MLEGGGDDGGVTVLRQALDCDGGWHGGRPSRDDLAGFLVLALSLFEVSRQTVPREGVGLVAVVAAVSDRRDATAFAFLRCLMIEALHEFGPRHRSDGAAGRLVHVVEDCNGEHMVCGLVALGHGGLSAWWIAARR